MVRKNMTNNEIYNTALALMENVVNLNLTLPVKVNFYLQKNVTALLAIAEDIEKTRTEILSKYGTMNEETGNYEFEDDNLEKVSQELIDLFELEQEVPIYEISLDAFGDIELNSNQFKAILYMIKDEEE